VCAECPKNTAKVHECSEPARSSLDAPRTEGALRQPMANAAIAGPRRTKQAPPPPQVAAQAQRQLPPLDYDEPTRSARPAARPPQVVTTPVKRGKAHRIRWFILGIAFGAVGAVVARGEAAQTLHDLRVWSARALRSLEHSSPPPPAKVQPSTAAPSAKPVALAIDAPCPMDPAAGDPCAELLAPFLDPTKAPVRTVSIDSLPRVKPPVIARHHRHVGPAAAPSPSPVASAPAEEPVDPPSDDDDDSTGQVTTAQNDPPSIR
jgi:hypothetical protein